MPLAIEFGKKYEVIGYDINKDKINLLKISQDPTREVTKKEFLEATYLNYTSNVKDLKGCNIFIVTVPTPIDDYKRLIQLNNHIDFLFKRKVKEISLSKKKLKRNDKK